MDRRLRLTKERRQKKEAAIKKQELKAKAEAKIDPEEEKRKREEEKANEFLAQQQANEEMTNAEQLKAAAEAQEKAAAEAQEKEMAALMAAAGITEEDVMNSKKEDTRARHPETGELLDPDEEELEEESMHEKKKRLLEEHAAKNKRTGLLGLWDKIRGGAKSLDGALTSYGPPYQIDYGGNLPEECSKHGGSMMEVHSCLSEGADPHLPLLTEDEQTGKILLNTPLHYACKFCNLTVAKMLKRADRAPSIINLVNAMGTSPLQMACMFSQPYTRKYKHLNLVKWLVEQGADINHVDRAGQTALHFAGYSGRLEVVRFLLNKGARATRKIEFLSLEQETAFDFARENMYHFSGPSRDRPMIERLLKGKGDMEDEDRKILAARKKELQAIEDAREADRLRKEARLKDRQDKMEERKRLRAEAMAATPEQKKKLEEAMQKEKAEKEAKMRSREHKAGIWKKAAKSNWDFKTGILEGEMAKQGLIDECLELSDSMRGDERQEKLRRRWKKLTGTRLVELDKDGNEVSRNQAILNSKAEREAELASVNAMADKDFQLPKLCI